MADKELIFGLHAVSALLERHAERILELYIQAERHDKKMEAICARANKKNIPIERLSRAELDRMTEMANHQGVIAICHQTNSYLEKDLKNILQKISGPPFILILDGVQDPHNLGACIRSADAAGVHLIIAPKDKSVGITPIVSKVASGAVESIPFVQVTNLVRTMTELKEHGVWIYGATEEAEQSIYTTDFAGGVALVLGAEGIGLRRLTKENCDILVKIPMQGSVASLNVSVAAGVLMFEVVRQRICKTSPVL